MADPDKPSSIYGKKFRIMLQIIPHPDGGYWTGTKMQSATNNVVGPSYFTSLRSEVIEIPRADKIEAIANAMGFPVELWFKDLSWWQNAHDQWMNGELVANDLHAYSEGSSEQIDMATLVNRLFAERIDQQTGQPFTDEEVAARSNNELSSADVRALRSGELSDPTWGQLLAVSNIFGVGLSYFSGSEAPSPPSELGTLEAKDDQESYVTFRNSIGMNKQQRSLLRSMSEHLRRENKRMHSDEGSNDDADE